ncbi:magnesium-translocating P-type ATPase [Bradyrhizobium lablabi]|uniref:magnesium-translocating P-type ATPase n=2 Tax=Nitrobacteraceae TaxID=41294 RepID=UPI00090AE12F|nr:magnesium-translocating P-type ATPase [Bradyrhizobium lablabi]SHM41854.1 Mg2+-importing ATPase [Bradyrhizobium lablabi]
MQASHEVKRADHAFWHETADGLLTRLGSRLTGLTQEEADRRLQTYGPNLIEATHGEAVLLKLGKRLLNPLVALLIAAAAISGISGDFGSFFIILAVLTLSITLDIVQEYHAEKAAEALRHSVAVRAEVVRDRTPVALPVSQLVPGDIVLLRIGDLVPADGLVLDSENLQLDESILTGEPFPARKNNAPCAAKDAADAQNALFAGTSVVAGKATMLLVETGQRTRFGAIASALAANVPPTALEQGVRRLGLLILRLTIFLTLFVLLAHLASDRPAMQSILFAVALAVGLTPELLPMVMTVTLARGAQRMARQKVIVKRLSAIHDLGAMGVLCFDKTGTLTQAKISLAECVDWQGIKSDQVLELARVNSRFQTGARSGLDDAILADCIAGTDWTRRGELPFDFSRRCLSVLAERGQDTLLVTKGAPEAVLSRAVAVEIDGLAHPLDESLRTRIDAAQQRLNAQGFRLLGVAVKSVPAGHTALTLDDERGLTFLGFCVFADPPKPDATKAVAELSALGVRLKVISGDHAAVVRHVAGAVGLGSDNVLTGAEIAELTDAGLAAKVEQIDLFARVDPDQKKRIIEALRKRGHVTGFLGDGINDAPAIHAAHVGLSVEGATDVARAAADMILLASDLNVLAEGVREGRRTFANILKYVRMGTSSNFGNMLSMALASLVLPFLPLLPLQILLNNLLYDLSEIGIPFDSVDAEETTRPHIWDMAAVLRFTIVMGVVSSLFDAATFLILWKGFGAGAAEFQTGWFLESIATQILVIFLIRTARVPWRSRAPHIALVVTSLGALAAAFFVVLGPLQSLFGFVPLPWPLVGAMAAVTVAYLASAEVAKHFALKQGA